MGKMFKWQSVHTYKQDIHMYMWQAFLMTNAFWQWKYVLTSALTSTWAELLHGTLYDLLTKVVILQGLTENTKKPPPNLNLKLNQGHVMATATITSN